MCSAGTFRIVGLQELQQHLAAEKQKNASAEEDHLQHCNKLQSMFEAQQQELARQKAAGTAAADRAASVQAQLEAAGHAATSLQSSVEEAGHAAASLQSQLAAVQLQLAAEQQRNKDSQHTVANLELQLAAEQQRSKDSQHTVANLEVQLQDMKQVTLVYGTWIKAIS